jgi:FkbM family methyltransferase
MRAVVSKVPPKLLNRIGQWQHEHAAARTLLAPVLRRIHTSDATIARGVGEGLRFNATGGNAGYTVGVTEPELQQALEQLLKPGDLFLDVGASIGFFTVIAARLVGPDGRVVAIEPSPAAVSALRHNVTLNSFTNVEVHTLALSDTSGTGTFAEGGKLVWGQVTSKDGGAEGNVVLTTLDELVLRHDLRPNVVKMDIEGAETDALRGASETLESIRPIVLCETHNTLPDVGRILSEHDYDVTHLDGSPLDPAAGQRFDYVMATPRARAA